MSLDEKLDSVLGRYQELSDRVASHPSPGSPEYTAMLKEYSDLTPVVERITELREAQSEIGDLAELIADAATEGEMREMAEAEFHVLKDRIPDLEHRIKVLLLPKDEADARNAILEVRAGTGGDEAALFGAELFRRYQRYAEARGWRFEILGYAETGIGGCKEASASISGKGVFARLKFESGVHRVQRVPVTESGGRIHTSAATVAVLAEAEEVDVQIDDKWGIGLVKNGRLDLHVGNLLCLWPGAFGPAPFACRLRPGSRSTGSLVPADPMPHRIGLNAFPGARETSEFRAHPHDGRSHTKPR